MSTPAHRRQRGWDTQAAVAAWFRAHGWPHAESAGAGRQGADITGLPGLSVEVKARRDLDPLAWIKQAKSRPAAASFVVFRPDGAGLAMVGQWPVLLTLEDLTGLLQDAGYGDPAADLMSGRRASLAAALRDIEAGRG